MVRHDGNCRKTGIRFATTHSEVAHGTIGRSVPCISRVVLGTAQDDHSRHFCFWTNANHRRKHVAGFAAKWLWCIGMILRTHHTNPYLVPSLAVSHGLFHEASVLNL